METMQVSGWFWAGFLGLVFCMLLLDLVVFNRKAHEIKMKEALLLSLFWILLAVGFNIFVWIWQGPQRAMEFLTAYLIEESLSIDNLFVFIMIFTYFQVKPEYQHKILFWGIIGAMVMRAIFIFTGMALIEKFHWIIYIFGGFLVITGIRMLFDSGKQIEPDKNPVIRLARRIIPVTSELHGSRFFVKINKKTFATSLFITLIMIEVTDLVFAIDSIPAVLAISNEPFIVYTSNVFAILGLRSLYFALASILKYFRFLKYGLAAILTFVGVKMIISGFYKIPIGYALGTVFGILLLSVLLSLMIPDHSDKK
jgi:tellurite resistance protein TerC